MAHKIVKIDWVTSVDPFDQVVFDSAFGAYDTLKAQEFLYGHEDE